MLDPEVKGKAATGYLWFYSHPKGDVLLEFCTGRGREGPEKRLLGFQGTIQTDAYAVYDSLRRQRPTQIKRLGCLAHVRRKWYKAAEESSAEAIWFIAQIRQLYLIEDETRDLSDSERKVIRRQKAPALWRAMKRRALELRADPRLLPKSSLGKAVNYFLNEYVADLAQTNARDWRCLEFLQLPASPYLWTDRSAPATAQRFYRAVQFGAPTNLVFIPPGTFWMGSPPNEVGRTDSEGPQTAVTLSRGFWMGKYLVTQGDYLALMGNNPSYFTTNDIVGNPISPDLTRPVEQVSWSDATNYCVTLTKRERAAGRIAANSVYRLPTEAEWEYACPCTPHESHDCPASQEPFA